MSAWGFHLSDLIAKLEKDGWQAKGTEATKDVGDSFYLKIDFSKPPITAKCKTGGLVSTTPWNEYTYKTNPKADKALHTLNEIVDILMAGKNQPGKNQPGKGIPTRKEPPANPKELQSEPERLPAVLTSKTLDQYPFEKVFLEFQITDPKYIMHRPGRGNQEVAYVEGWYLKQILNLATKWKWSSKIEGMKETPTEIIVWGSVTITMPDGSQHTQSAFGSSEIHLRKDNGKPVSLGDDYKAAATDMIKKAISQWGIASDVYRGET